MKRGQRETNEAEAPGLDALLCRIDRSVGVIAAALKAIRSSLPEQDAVVICERLAALEEEIPRLGAAHGEVGPFRHEWEHRLDRAFLDMESRLVDGCVRRGWRVEGHWPDLYVERAIHVGIDTRKRVAFVGGKRTSPTVPAVIAELEPLVRTLLPNNFSPQAFIEELYTAYDHVRASGQQVGVFEVYRSYVVLSQQARFWRDARSAGFVGLSVDQFRARLVRALEAAALTAANGSVLRLHPPLDPKDAIFVFIPSEERFAFVGRLEFAKSGE